MNRLGIIIMIGCLCCLAPEMHERVQEMAEQKMEILAEGTPTEQTSVEQTSVEQTSVEETPLDVSGNEVGKIMQIYDIEEGYLEVPFDSTLKTHTYDWNQITTSENGYKHYIEGNEESSVLGIDVSGFQEVTDWNKVKESGVEFVIIRVGFRGYGIGTLIMDKRFEEHIKGATEAGLEVGVYFFSQAITTVEAVEEADFVIEHLKNYNITYPVVFDTEKIKGDTARTDGLTVEELTEITNAFCQRIEEAGYTSMIYANAKWLTTKLDLQKLQDIPVWYADYQEKPLYLYDFSMWQYTESGSVPGVEGVVDLNLFFK